MMLESTVIRVQIKCEYAYAYEFLVDPLNFPEWATGLAQGIEKYGDAWLAKATDGRMIIRFTQKNDFGILDHYVTPPHSSEIYIPMRLIRNQGGCEVYFTLFREAHVTAEKFSADIDWVKRDLEALRYILEN